MKGTEHFKEALKALLDEKAAADELFAKRYATTKRTIDDVATYVINQVKASGCCGFTTEEVASMACHVIDEPNIEVGKPIPCQVVVDRQVKLTDEEIAEAKAKAREQVMREQREKMLKPATPKRTQTQQVAQAEPSLFDAF